MFLQDANYQSQNVDERDTTVCVCVASKCVPILCNWIINNAQKMNVYVLTWH